jgi:hypothetical protein
LDLVVSSVWRPYVLGSFAKPMNTDNFTERATRLLLLRKLSLYCYAEDVD